MKLDKTLKTCAFLLWLAIVIPVGLAQVEPRAAVIFPRQPATGYTADCTVIRVIDGDTLEVSVSHKLHIRLLQCWAPESRTKDKAEKARGLAAKEHLQELVAASPDGVATVFIPMGAEIGKSITLSRHLGYVWIRDDPISLNQHQVEGGFALVEKRSM